MNIAELVEMARKYESTVTLKTHDAEGNISSIIVCSGSFEGASAIEVAVDAIPDLGEEEEDQWNSRDEDE